MFRESLNYSIIPICKSLKMDKLMNNPLTNKSVDMFSQQQMKSRKVNIIVMGTTGSGKSTFINLASHANLRVSGLLRSCTQEVELSPSFNLYGNEVTLIDTPGFDDTDRGDIEVLQIITAFLEAQYRQGIQLHGVLYLHRISDNRVGGASKRSFEIFRKLCGDEALKNVVLATNMWSQVKSAEGKAREKELMNDNRFLKPALDKGARMRRHDGTIESAHNLLREICNNSPMPLTIQTELVNENKYFYNTSTGQEISRRLQELIEKHTREMTNIGEEIIEAQGGRDTQSTSELMEEQKMTRALLAKIQKELRSLPSEYYKYRQKAMRTVDSSEGVQLDNDVVGCFAFLHTKVPRVSSSHL